MVSEDEIWRQSVSLLTPVVQQVPGKGATRLSQVPPASRKFFRCQCPTALVPPSAKILQSLGLQADDFLPSVVDLRDQVRRAARAIRRPVVPQRDEGERQMQDERIEQHPQVVPLPDAVVLLASQPDRQLSRL